LIVLVPQSFLEASFYNMRKCTRCKVERDDEMFYHKNKNKFFSTCGICRDTSKRMNYRRKHGEKSPKQLIEERREDAVKRGNFICSMCHTEKPLSEFRTKNAPTICIGYSYTCNLCRKLIYRFSKLKRYGVNKELFFKMFNDQDRKCAICKKELKIADTEKMRATTLCLDHNHSTNKVRGILCNNCNRGLGFLGDNKDIILSAYKYLLDNDE
jgi:hypothetical protein